ncbi:MAG: hypothetical protein WB988_03655 [Candidatus Nitrosopolaris sp.]|jgi:hypothetical protein
MEYPTLHPGIGQGFDSVQGTRTAPLGVVTFWPRTVVTVGITITAQPIMTANATMMETDLFFIS